MASSNKTIYDINKAEELFEQFIKDYNREYKDEEEKKMRFDIFVKSIEKINKLNSSSQTATFGINKFADYTADEMGMMRGLKKQEH